MHLSQSTQAQGPLLRPVRSTLPFRATSAAKRRSCRALQRTKVTSALQDLVHAIQETPLVTGAIATTGEAQ